MNNFSVDKTPVNILSQSWWIILWRGIAALIFGLITWFNPVITLYVMLIFFSGYAFVDGTLGIVMSFKGRRYHKDWWLLFIWASANFLTGILTFFIPIVTVVVLTDLLAIWAIVSGVLQMTTAIGLRKSIQGEGWMALGGILSIILGIVLFINPVQGGIAITWLMGIYAILFGIISIILAFRVRRSAQKTV
jgi:uncharacterized membrane protein HdeD (DUF308 family)